MSHQASYPSHHEHYFTYANYYHNQPHGPFHFAPNQGCNVNITMDTTEQADDLRAAAEQIKQRRLAAAAAKQPITISDFESLKQDLTRQIRAVFVRATLSVCYVQIETLKFPLHM